MVKKVLFLVVYALLVKNVSADISDTIVSIQGVETNAVRFERFSPGAKIYKIDSLILSNYNSGSMAELLLNSSLVNVTTYGPGGMGNVSMRGGTSDHTAIIWNGFNLKPPMSGTANYSALPVSFIDQVYIQPGGSSTLYGSGAATGVIFLSNDIPINNSGFQGLVSAEGSSYHSKASNMKLLYSGKKFASAVRAGYSAAKNDFIYKNTAKFSTPDDTLQNAAYKSLSISQQNAVQINANSRIETDVWYVKYFKEIPSQMSDFEDGDSEQTDESLRAAVNYATYFTNWYLKLRSGIFNNKIFYVSNDPVFPQENMNKSLSFINEAEMQYSENSFHLNLGVNQTFETAESGSYTSVAKRNRIAAFGRYDYLIGKDFINFCVESRVENVDGEFIPFIFSIGSQIRIIDNLFFKQTFARHYSLPDMNDLFWADDGMARGNPNLLPESGWNFEAGMAHNFQHGKVRINNELTFFRNRISDLIVWINPGSGIWAPENISDSKSYGVEYIGTVGTKFEKSSLFFDTKFAYTNARTLKSEEDKEWLNRRYVPKYKLSVLLNYKYKDLAVQYSQNYFSERFYDNQNTLDAYTTADICINYAFRNKKIVLSPYLKAKNIFNTSYQVMVDYAQPGRAYHAGINLKF